jgi:signal transduction histidine kinase
MRKRPRALRRHVHRGAHDKGMDVSLGILLYLAEAASGLCREISAQHRVEVIFQSEDVSTDLSRDVSLCLFRVLQEALQNAIKYSGTRDFHVSLVGATGEIHLTVLDSGIGFDPEKPSRKAASG